jgi:antitoxin (DNA-binding transcriptional repressor) of toxin-antitoxin stability system
MLAIGGIVLAVIVGAYLFMNMNSNSGGITFTPSTLSCSSPVAFTTTAHLPASVKAGDNVTITLDGKQVTSGPVSSVSDLIQQPDGSWTSTSTTSPSTMQSICAAGGSSGGFNILTPGTHTMQVLDASGKVLAKGSYTVTP